METLRIETVTGCADAGWYDEYRRLRYRIFVDEQGWTGLTDDQPTDDNRTVADPADMRASFWLARSSSGELVGAVRVRAVADAFPHRELFEHHLRRPEMRAVLPWMGTLNSLAVVLAHRGREWKGGGNRTGTAAHLLLHAALEGSAQRGLRAIVATAQTSISAKALCGAGFHVIDPPIRTPLHDRFLMCNVGIALRGPADRLRAVRAVSAYFDTRERLVLSSTSIDDLFSNEPLVRNLDSASQATPNRSVA